jgi:hypothetical protein
MKTKKLLINNRLLFKYREWKSARQDRDLNKMIAYSMDAAISLANRKRDILNHKSWVVAGSGIFLVFARFQKKNLQSQGLLKSNLTSKDLDEMASYVALPFTEKNKKRGGIIRKYLTLIS